MISGVPDSTGALLRLLDTQVDSLRLATDSLRIASETGKNTPMQGWLPLVIAALAVFFGPLVQLRIAKRQIGSSALIAKRQIHSSGLIAKRQIQSSVLIAKRQINATVLSSNRQKWIDKLRSNIADFLSVSLDIVVASQEQGANTRPKHIRLWRLRFTIRLMLNPKEPDHQSLNDLLGKVVEVITLPGTEKEKVAAGKEKMIALRPLIEEVNVLAQSILKREWERVKALD